ncbi:MAG: hypothetical protein GY705_22275 [Bacteroidetes bacterium]|nr:hypothetical protein [Bacteroidota bacterium]
MKEGWHNDDYLILFEGEEIEEKGKEYEIDRFLPGHLLFGLLGWDDFLVLDKQTEIMYHVPTVPLVEKEKEPWSENVDVSILQPDERFEGKIKWYVKPIIFGGNPKIEENMTWISHQDHVAAVKYWNKIYIDVSKNK